MYNHLANYSETAGWIVEKLIKVLFHQYFIIPGI